MDLTALYSFPNTTIRLANEGDIDALVSIINDAFSYQDKAKGEPRIDVPHLQKKMGKTSFYVIEDQDKIVGCFYIQPLEDSLYFGLLVVVPSYRKTGLAPAIMKAIESFARAEKYDNLTLDYGSLSPWLKKYYEGYGFKETGITEDIGWSQLIHMRKSHWS